MNVTHRIRASLLVVILASYGQVGLAQQINGVPGSPSATMTIDGKQLPPRDNDRLASTLAHDRALNSPKWPNTPQERQTQKCPEK